MWATVCGFRKGTGVSAESTNRVVIVVGGAMGIGEAIVERLARDHATVVIADSDANERLAQQVADNLHATGRSVSAETVDITDDGQVAALAEATVEIHGRLDAVIYCGIGEDDTTDLAPLIRFSGDEITRSSGAGTIVLISDAPELIDLSAEHERDGAVALHTMSPTTFRILDAVSELLSANRV